MSRKRRPTRGQRHAGGSATGEPSVETARAEPLPRHFAAVVRLPYEVMRGWEWLPHGLLGVLAPFMLWLHVTKRFTWTTGRYSRTPMPDWLVGVITAGFVAFLVWLIFDRIWERRRARQWMDEVAKAIPGLSPSGVAAVIAEYLGLDPEGFATLNRRRLLGTVREIGQNVPRLWIDAEIAPRLQGAAPTRLLTFALRSSDRRFLVPAIYVLLLPTLAALPLLGGLLSGSMTQRDIIVFILLGVVGLWLLLGLVLWFSPRYELLCMPGRAVITRRGREVAAIDPDTALMAIVARRIHLRSGYETRGTRWWFFLPRLPALYADDLSPGATPWSEAVADAAAFGPGPEGRPGECPKCGYSLAGLELKARCPECGSNL